MQNQSVTLLGVEFFFSTENSSQVVPWFHCSKNITPPKMNECRLRRDRFKRKRNIFQPSIFRGYSLVFRGTNSEDAFLAIKAFGSFMSRHDSISIPVNQPLTMVQKRRAGNWLKKTTRRWEWKKETHLPNLCVLLPAVKCFWGVLLVPPRKSKGSQPWIYWYTRAYWRNSRHQKIGKIHKSGTTQTTNPPCLFVHSHPQSINPPQINGCSWFP